MTDQHNHVPDDDMNIEALLREVGARDEPPSDLMNDVRGAVHAEWRAMLAERSRRRRTFTYGLAASIVLAVIVSTLAQRWTAPEASLFATVARVEGSPQRHGGEESGYLPGDRILEGETLSTDGISRVALDVGHGMSLRIDRNSSVRIAARDRLVLAAGAIYVDADPDEPQQNKLTIETLAGEVRHLGTQYLIRQMPRSVEISIREGRVQVVSTDGARVLACQGEQLRVSTAGAIERKTITATDSLWDWVQQLAPAFDIQDQKLTAFLEWVARETGRTLVYDNQQARELAAAVTLRGSIAGLDPDEALGAVLSTTELARVPTQDDVIHIALAAPAEAMR